MADGKGKLSYSEFSDIRPKTDGNTTTIEFLISGTVGSNFELSGEHWIVGVNIPYQMMTEAGVQNNKPALATLNRISLTGIKTGSVATLTVTGDRKMMVGYASFEVVPYPLSQLDAQFLNPDPSNPFWSNTASIHFEYDCTESLENGGSINFIPNNVVKVYVDEYDVTIGMAQGLRGSKFVMPVKSDLDTVPLRISSSITITGSVADSYFADSGIVSGHFCGTKCYGQYEVSSKPGFVSASHLSASLELLKDGTRRDPAFMYLTGFSGSIIKDEYTDKDVEAGTITFEELKFSRYRVSGSKEDYFAVTDSPREQIMVPYNAVFFENVVLPITGSDFFEKKRRPHQRYCQYFELFSTGSGTASVSRDMTDMFMEPPTMSTSIGSESSGTIISCSYWNTGSLTLPELCDIVYRHVSGSSRYARTTNNLIYVAESNAIYETDKYGRVVGIKVLSDTGSVEESEEDSPRE